MTGKAVMVAALLAQSAALGAAQDMPNTVTKAGVTLKWNVTEDCYLEFEASAEGADSWVAIGLGQEMVGTAAIVAEPSLGPGEVHAIMIDEKSRAGVKVINQDSNDLDMVMVERADGRVTMSGRIMTIGGNDIGLPCANGNGEDSVVFARGKTGFDYHGETKDVAIVVWVNPDDGDDYSAPPGDGGDDDDDDDDTTPPGGDDDDDGDDDTVGDDDDDDSAATLAGASLAAALVSARALA